MESVNLLDSLLSLGHIKYPRFDQHIRFTSENLQILLEKLKVDQVKWKFALKELRDESYHFNDFFGYQIVSLRNFFMNSCSDHEINIVSNLLLSVTSGSSKDIQARSELISTYRGSCQHLKDSFFESEEDRDVMILKEIVRKLMTLRSEMLSEGEQDVNLEKLKHDGIAVVLKISFQFCSPFMILLANHYEDDAYLFAMPQPVKRKSMPLLSVYFPEIFQLMVSILSSTLPICLRYQGITSSRLSSMPLENEMKIRRQLF
jgi:hypothetical protein